MLLTANPAHTAHTLKRLFFFMFLGVRWCSTLSTYILSSFWYDTRTFTGYCWGQCSWNHSFTSGTSHARLVRPDRRLKGRGAYSSAMPCKSQTPRESAQQNSCCIAACMVKDQHNTKMSMCTAARSDCDHITGTAAAHRSSRLAVQLCLLQEGLHAFRQRPLLVLLVQLLPKMIEVPSALAHEST